MLVDGPLGRSSRTGRENAINRIVRADIHPEVRPVPSVTPLVEDERFAVDGDKIRRRIRISNENDTRSDLFENRVNALLRSAGIERDKSRTRLHDSEFGDQKFGAGIHQNRNEVSGAYSSS